MKSSAGFVCTKFVGYRVGSTYCLTPTASIDTIIEMPSALDQLPGTKPWVLGAKKLGKDLTLYINLSHFLGIPNTDPRDQKKQSSPALVLRESASTGSIGLRVDELIGFIHMSQIEDVEDPNFTVPLGFGSCLCGTVKARDTTWALIDLHALATDERLHKIDLT